MHTQAHKHTTHTHAQVLSDLPPKIIQDVYCELSPLQRALYEDFQQSQVIAKHLHMLSLQVAFTGSVHRQVAATHLQMLVLATVQMGCQCVQASRWLLAIAPLLKLRGV